MKKEMEDKQAQKDEAARLQREKEAQRAVTQRAQIVTASLKKRSGYARCALRIGGCVGRRRRRKAKVLQAPTSEQRRREPAPYSSPRRIIAFEENTFTPHTKSQRTRLLPRCFKKSIATPGVGILTSTLPARNARRRAPRTPPPWSHPSRAAQRSLRPSASTRRFAAVSPAPVDSNTLKDPRPPPLTSGPTTFTLRTGVTTQSTLPPTAP